MRYFAIQDKQPDAATKALAPAMPVVHEFPSRSARDAWVARGHGNGQPYRRKATASEVAARRKEGCRATSAVKHLYRQGK